MEREVSLEDLKKLYTSSDMVKADCGGCQGCSECCRGMGESIVLDPLDIHRLTVHLGAKFQELVGSRIELHVSEGLVLPSLKMEGEEEKCTFLNEEGRCRIHAFRPGLCRLFPLGRFYENGSFKYYLQHQECSRTHKTKIKVSKWVDTPDLKQYEAFVTKWHYFLKDVKALLEQSKDQQLTKDLSMYILNGFYVQAYDKDRDFYEQFEERMQQTGKLLAVLSRSS